MALDSYLRGKGRNYTNSANGSSSVGRATGGQGSSGGVATATAEPGVLADIAAKVLMKVLYGARMARFDLLRAVCSLACSITKWDKDCDRKLHRLMC